VNFSRFSDRIETDKSGLCRITRATDAHGRAGRCPLTGSLASFSGIQLMSLGLIGEYVGTTLAEAERASDRAAALPGGQRWRR